MSIGNSRHPYSVVGAILLGSLSACSNGPEDPPGRTGLALTTDILAGTDVGRMRFELTRVSCASETISPFAVTEERDLEDTLIPGGIPDFDDQPLDADSEHLFADLYISLDPGCYDVTTTPLTPAGDVSADCASAFKPGVVVTDGVTTEVMVINQCLSEGPGGLDVISVLNHPPVLENVEFELSKFGETCVPRVICATVSDPDSDPLEIVWNVDSALDFSGPNVVNSVINPDGSVTECVEITANEPGTFDVSVTAYDLLHDAMGSLIRIEDFLAAEGYPNDSHDTVAFPLYASGDICAVCGDGVVEGPEECDDGNASQNDACLNDCTANVCGDGFVNSGVEACDDGNTVDDDGCSNSCVDNIGCSDGEREGFLGLTAFPDIAGCSGGFTDPGVFNVNPPACGLLAGDDSADPLGAGCRVEDFCAPGWHVCSSSSDVAASNPSGCAGATAPGDPELFFLTRQSGGGSASCNAIHTNDLFGCGNFGGGPDPVSCSPLDRFSGDQCGAIQPYWQCGGNGGNEALVVTKSSTDGGGLVCCRD